MAPDELASQMGKEHLLQLIIATLTTDLAILTKAAMAAHSAATHEECIADNKYDTTGLEASYVAQGQANRAQEIRQALESYRNLTLHRFDEETPIRLTAMVTLQAEDKSTKQVFLGPVAGGLKLLSEDGEWIVITPESMIGRALLGKFCGDEIQIGRGTTGTRFTIINLA